MKSRSHHLSFQSGMTIIELMVVVVVVGILGMVAVTRYLSAQDRAHVTAAAADADHFRKALAIYSVDYATFPTGNFSNPIALCLDLADPNGNRYMVLPEGETFTTFHYEPVDEGESYRIEITAKDNGETLIVATPDGTEIIG